MCWQEKQPGQLGQGRAAGEGLLWPSGGPCPSRLAPDPASPEVRLLPPGGPQHSWLHPPPPVAKVTALLQPLAGSPAAPHASDRPLQLHTPSFQNRRQGTLKPMEGQKQSHEAMTRTPRLPARQRTKAGPSLEKRVYQQDTVAT